MVDVADIRKQLCEVQANTKGTNEKLASTEQKLTVCVILCLLMGDCIDAHRRNASNDRVVEEIGDENGSIGWR